MHNCRYFFLIKKIFFSNIFYPNLWPSLSSKKITKSGLEWINIGPTVKTGLQLSRIWRDSHAFDLLLTQLTNLLTHLKKIENNQLFLIIIRLTEKLFIVFLLQNHLL